MRIRNLDSLAITAMQWLGRLRGIAPLAAIVAAQLAIAAPAHAQAGEVAGTVTAAGTGEPLAGAQVTVAGGPQRAVTDDRGRFRITGISGPTVTLEVRRIGYRLERVPTRAGETNLGVVLSVNPASLEAVVVTGTAGATERRAIGNAVATINAAEVTEVAPIQSMQQLLNGRAPGVVIMPASGAVGTGQQVRVRGLSSFALGNNPLLYVDGVRVNNTAASGPDNQAFGSTSISRLNDINPQDIESIEILKGPSAATLYGTEASNGVINIITKKGATGAARWTANVREGVNYLKDWRTRFPTNYGPIGGTGQIVPLNMDSLLVGNNGNDIFRNGLHHEAELAISGGTDRFNYYASGHVLDSQGAEPSNFTKKYTTRLNLGINPSSQLRLSGTMGFVTGPTNLSAEAGYGGRVWSTLLATPTTYNSFQHGFYSGIPERYDLVYKMWQDLDRFTGSLRAEHQPASWFQHRVTVGLDRTREANNWHFPRIDSLVSDPTFGSEALGYREVDGVSTTYRTFDYAATANWDARPHIRLSTSAGAQYYYSSTDTVAAWGSVFPTPGLSAVNATTESRGQSQDFLEDVTLGYFVQEQLAWSNRLYLTGAVRWDRNSAFGANFNQVVYPKYSLSWVVSEEGWWRGTPFVGSALNSFRVRAAYGEAGKAPSTYSALRTFAPAVGPNDSPAVTPLVIGNPDLGPERGKEFELGFDAGAFNDRANLEVTFYNKKTTDAILNRQLAPSIGFSGVQPFNAGAIRNQGMEVSLRGTPYRGDRVSWDLTATLATNDNKVLSLMPGTQFVTVTTYSNGPHIRHQVGYPAFAWFHRRVLSAQLDASGQAIRSTVMCDDGAGGSTPCYNAAGTAIAPLVYLGRSVPSREGALSTNVSFLNNFRIYTQVDFKSGSRKVDGNTRVRCFFFGGRCRENFFPAESDPVRVAQVQSNGQLIDFLVANSSFAKWRELTLSYDIPERFYRMANATRASVSLSGRNLHTWTNYPGFEPEAMFLGGSRGGNTAFEQTTLPQLTTWMVMVNLGF